MKSYIIYRRARDVARRIADLNEWEAANVTGTFDNAVACADSLAADSTARGQHHSYRVFEIGKRGRPIGHCLYQAIAD